MIAVVIPCHRVRKHVLAVLAAIGPEVGRVYVVDDGALVGVVSQADIADAVATARL